MDIHYLFNSDNFMPHGHCYLWLPQILWLHVVSDFLIGVSYYSIPAALFYFVRKRTDIPFKMIFLLFCCFILFCGTTHFVNIWVIWHPDYFAQGILNAITALISCVSAIVCWKIIPQALKLRSPAELEKLNTQLQNAYANIESVVETRTSELRALNEKLEKREEDLKTALLGAQAANEAKSNFLANMSHEMRTPMNVISGIIYILNAGNLPEEKNRELIKTLKTSADSLLALINDLLDIAKIEAGATEIEQKPFYLAALLEETAAIMSVPAGQKGLRLLQDITCGCATERPFIGDNARLRQILLNLCNNAIKFTEQGTVKISVACEKTQRENIERLTIAVSDTGIGIPADKLDSIFAKFVQVDSSISRNYGGTGLGLAISKALIEQMHGEITVTSEPGKGSVFTISVELKRL